MPIKQTIIKFPHSYIHMLNAMKNPSMFTARNPSNIRKKNPPNFTMKITKKITDLHVNSMHSSFFELPFSTSYSQQTISSFDVAKYDIPFYTLQLCPQEF